MDGPRRTIRKKTSSAVHGEMLRKEQSSCYVEKRSPERKRRQQNKTKTKKNELALLNEKKTGGGACRSRAKPSMAV